MSSSAACSKAISRLGRPKAISALRPGLILSSARVQSPICSTRVATTVPRALLHGSASRAAAPNLTGDPNQHSTEKFANGLTGSCLCGSITVKINDDELFTKRRGHLCHCANCRKVAGSFVSSNLIIEEDKVEISDRDGTLKEFRDKNTGSGTPLGRWFCSGCGNPVKSVVPAYEGKVILKMGMFPRIPAPEFETFGLHRHEWQGRHPNMPQYKIKAGQEKLGE